MRFLIASIAALALTGNALAAGDIEAGKARAQVCAACHGNDGNTTVDNNTPKLAGQYSEYLVKVIKDYRSGARTNAIMNTQSAALKDQEIEDLAAYYASLPAQIKDLSESK